MLLYFKFYVQLKSKESFPYIECFLFGGRLFLPGNLVPGTADKQEKQISNNALLYLQGSGQANKNIKNKHF